MADIAAAFANAMLDAGIALLNGGTIELQTAGGTEVATGTLNATASAGSASGGSVTFAAITKDDSCAGGGPITKAILKTSGAASLIRATATEATGVPETEPEITLDNDTPTAGIDVYFSSLTMSMTVVAL